MAPISSHGCRASAALRSPRGCRSRSGRMRRRDPYAAAAALSNAPGIVPAEPAGAAGGNSAARPAIVREPNDPAAWGDAARSPTAGKIWRTTPPSRADTSAARPRFSAQIRPAKLVVGRVEPFSFRPDKTLPGTLHHSGNKPAPPSDHIPLARRSAFQQGQKRGRRRNSAASAGLKHSARRFYRAYARRSVCQHASWNLAVPLPVIAGEPGRSKITKA